MIDLQPFNRLVNNVARRAPLNWREDARQEAWIGVLKAVETHDAAKGAGLLGYGYRRAQGAVLEFLRATDHLTRNHRKAIKRGDAEPIDVVSGFDDSPDFHFHATGKNPEQLAIEGELVDFMHATLSPSHARILWSSLCDGQVSNVGESMNQSRVSIICRDSLRQLRSGLQIAACARRAATLAALLVCSAFAQTTDTKAFAIEVTPAGPTKLSIMQVSYPPLTYTYLQIFTPTGGILQVALDPSIQLDMSGTTPTLRAVLPAGAVAGTVTPRRTEVFVPTTVSATVTVSLVPDDAQEVHLWRNGLLLAPIIDYTRAGAVFTFIPLQTPAPGDILQVSYGPV